MELLKYIVDRANESGTWAGIAAALLAANINIDPGLWHTITFYGVAAASTLAVVLRDRAAGADPGKVLVDALTNLPAAMAAANAQPPAKATDTPKPAGIPVSSVGGAVALLVALGASLSACAPATQQQALSSPTGQLFCAVQLAGGGAVVAGMVNAEATSAAPGAAPLAIIATNATKAFVDRACATAGGIPVVPPANPATAPQIAVIPPNSAT